MVRVAVLPFSVQGGDSVVPVGAAVVEMLSASLDGADVEPVEPGSVRAWAKRDRATAKPDDDAGDAGDAARGLRADAYVTGELTTVGGRLRINARWYAVRARGLVGHGGDSLVARASAEGDPAHAFALVDRIAAELLADRHTGSGARLARAAAEETASLAAFKAYLAGEQELQLGDYARAIDEFRRAVAADSAFALAHYRLSVAADWAGRDAVAIAEADAAARFAPRLRERDRALVLALAAVRHGDYGAAEARYSALVDDYPDDVEAWFQYGELLFHANPLRGRSATEARRAFEQVRRLDPGNEEALVHLARVEAVDGRRPAVDSLVSRLLAGRARPRCSRCAPSGRSRSATASGASARRSRSSGTPGA
jgi:tetratricopeptide (TPR) repeat protein